MNEYYIEGGQYSIYDPDRYSTANYEKDAAIIAAAGLVGCLYRVAAGAMLIASIAALSVLRAVELGVVVGVGVYVGIKHGSPVGVAGSVLGGAVVGAAGLAFVATAIAFTAILTPLIVVSESVRAAQNAANAPKAGVFERVFGHFRNTSKSVNDFKEMINTQTIKKWGANVKNVD